MRKRQGYITMTEIGFRALKGGLEKDIGMRVYQVFPGVDVYYNDYRTKLHFQGQYTGGSYHQLAYCHSGVYESRVAAHRTIRLCAQELMVFSDIVSCLESSLPLGYYQGLNIMFHPQRFTGETVHILESFSIDIGLLFERLMKQKLFCRFTCSRKLTSILEELYLFAEKGDIRRMKASVIRLLVEMECCDEVMEKEYWCCDRKSMQIIEQVRRYIEENEGGSLTVRKLAEETGVSETTLKKYFRTYFGCSPYEFMKRGRMNRAAELLKKTDISVSEIGMRAGYENPSKFSAAFGSVYHMTPREFRKKARMEHCGEME